MSYKYVIDSFAWLEYYNGTKRVEKVKHIIEDEEIATSIITIAELSDKFVREDLDFEQFLIFIQSRSVVLPITLNIALKAGKLKNEIRKKHRDFGLADAIILQTAIENQVTLISGDPEFENLENVLLI